MLSIRVCIVRKCGISLATTTETVMPSSGTEIVRSQDICRFSRRAMMMPPMHISGALTSIEDVSMTRAWICRTSLVLRVISVGAPKLLNSRSEKLPTAL